MSIARETENESGDFKALSEGTAELSSKSLWNPQNYLVGMSSEELDNVWSAILANVFLIGWYCS